MISTVVIAKPNQMLERGRMRQPGEAAAQCFRDARVSAR